jgi:phospholipid transport system substrate-binding protein
VTCDSRVSNSRYFAAKIQLPDRLDAPSWLSTARQIAINIFLGGFIVTTNLQILAACLVISMGAGFTALAAVAADSGPDMMVKYAVEEVLTAIKQNKDRRVLREITEQKVLPHFDFRHMTQLAMGKSWRDATPEQQQALEKGFRTLLVNTYSTALTISAGGGDAVEVKPLQVPASQDEITVKTTVRDADKQAIAIDYRMARSPDGWKVFDVVIENLSLVTNYRGTFASEIARSGIDGLIRKLDAKNRAFAST